MRRARGFTLIEVLVALAIVAIGMAAVMRTVTSSADTVFYLRDKTFAQWVALNRIANLRVTGQTPGVGNSEGDTDYAGRKWHWRQEVTALDIPGAERIDVRVRPAEVKGDADSGWYTTVSGVWGDAVAAPRGDSPDWGSQLMGPPANGPNGGTTPIPGNPKQ
ncbi:MAG TPA: type II secretion system minor pseudopilin GspI [Steroidobacteraceae bacterium]|jgi:general secretion pathway protein I